MSCNQQGMVLFEFWPTAMCLPDEVDIHFVVMYRSQGTEAFDSRRFCYSLSFSPLSLLAARVAISRSEIAAVPCAGVKGKKVKKQTYPAPASFLNPPLSRLLSLHFSFFFLYVASM